MIVVAGIPRSGTSMVMLLLKRLGVDVAGEEFLQRGKNFTPTGIWEVFGLPNLGITKDILSGKTGRQTLGSDELTHTPIECEAVKLTFKGLLRSDPTIIKRLILCIRDPREVLVSQRSQLGFAGDKKHYDAFIVHMAALVDAIPERMLQHCLVMDYGQVVKWPKAQTRRIVEYLDLDVDLKTIKKAASIVSKKHYRSKKNMMPLDETAHKFYRYLKGFIP